MKINHILLCVFCLWILSTLAIADISDQSLYFCGEEQEFWQPIIVDGQSFFPADLLISSFGGKKYLALSKQKLALTFFNGQKLRCAIKNRFIFLQDEAYLLPYPIQVKDGVFLLPVAFFTEILPQKYEQHFVFDALLRKLYFFRKPLGIVDFSLAKNANKELFTIHCNPSVEVQMVELSDEIQLIFREEPLNPMLAVPRSQLLADVGAELQDRGLVFRFQKGEADLQHRFFRDDEQQICLEFSRKTVSKKAPEKTFAFQTIVIDPGHGGKDPGAIGKYYNTYEKNVVLPIALEVQKICQKELGLNVLLTRSDDTFIPLKNRTEFANAQKADLFISIHANSVASGKASGSEVYFLSPAKTPEAKMVEELENAVLKYEYPEKTAKELDALAYILWDMHKTEYLKESSELAQKIFLEMENRRVRNGRGVNQANFYVLRGAFMPAALVEVGYLSSKAEEKKLRSAAYQKKLARWIVDGILQFKNLYEQVNNHHEE